MGKSTLTRIPHDKQVAVGTLHRLGYSIRKIMPAVDLGKGTVHAIIKQFQPNEDELETFKKGLLFQQYGISQRAITRISDEKLDQMNALQLMTINAIGIDKARDMEGANRPVFNIVNVVQEVKSTREKLEKQMGAIAARRAQLSGAEHVQCE